MAKRIKEWRAKRDMINATPPRRQAQSRAHRRIEFGQRDPTLSALEKIAAAFKVNVERLLE